MSQNQQTHKHYFTQEQVEHLRANHYVQSVSKSTIRFNEDFKRYFYQQRTSGKNAYQIFSDCGIDPEMLGESRIDGFCYTLNKYAKRATGFMDNRQNNYHHPSNTVSETHESRIKYLEYELAYTRQEVEFLKKPANGRYGGSETMESKHRPK